MPGWKSARGLSIGYHGDDGGVFALTDSYLTNGPQYTEGDTVGCGVDYSRGTIFITKNGELLGKSTLFFLHTKPHLDDTSVVDR